MTSKRFGSQGKGSESEVGGTPSSGDASPYGGRIGGQSSGNQSPDSPSSSPAATGTDSSTFGQADSVNKVDAVPASEEDIKGERVASYLAPKGESKQVKLFRTEPRTDGRVVAVVPDSNPVQAYLVPEGRLKLTYKELQPLVIDAEVEPVHDWYSVIDALLPSRDEIINNVVLSMIRAGAHTEGEVKDKQVRSRLFRHAYPYQLEE